ncbi:hypothetical protein Dimus_002803 [Dionaea muscipula]
MIIILSDHAREIEFSKSNVCKQLVLRWPRGTEKVDGFMNIMRHTHTQPQNFTEQSKDSKHSRRNHCQMSNGVYNSLRRRPITWPLPRCCYCSRPSNSKAAVSTLFLPAFPCFYLRPPTTHPLPADDWASVRDDGGGRPKLLTDPEGAPFDDILLANNSVLATCEDDQQMIAQVLA